MKKDLIISASTVALLFFPTSAFADAHSMACSGTISGVGQAPITIMAKKDGSKVNQVGNTGIVNTVQPADHPTNGAASACTGIANVSADGKSQIGHGHCQYVDKDGDTYMLSWNSDMPGKGTWKVNWGNGKYAKYKAEGTYAVMMAYQTGQFVTGWKGTCDLGG